MLLRITQYCDLDERKLMDLYSEDNYENTAFFYPEIADQSEAVRKVEDSFLEYLKNEFFTYPGRTYWILAEQDLWLSALRISRIEPELYYLEALATHPDYRNQGYASRLLNEVINALKQEGPFRLCDCVGKKNAASLRTHEKSGFRIVSNAGFDYLQGEADAREYGLEYRNSAT